MTRGTLASPSSGQLGSKWHVLAVNTATLMSALARLLQLTYVVLASSSASALDQTVTYSKTPVFLFYVVSSEGRRGLRRHTRISLQYTLISPFPLKFTTAQAATQPGQRSRLRAGRS